MNTAMASGYQWYFNGNIIAGANSSYYIPSQNGIYSVEVTNANGSTGRSADYNYTTTGINESVNSNLISVYPNPASEKLIVHASNEMVNSEFLLISVSGKIVLKTKLENSENTIDLTGISEGIYFAKTENGSSKFLTKVFIKR